jgi:hypothetical protein
MDILPWVELHWSFMPDFWLSVMIFFIGGTGLFAIDKSRAAGVTEWIDKPFTGGKLRDVVKRFLSRGQGMTFKY